MSQADRTASNVAAPFHPVSYYDTPQDVVRDARLSSAEKRVILSSWASDIFATDSHHPGLRKIPGIVDELRLDDILAALKQLDDDNDLLPGGGATTRLPRLNKIDWAASDEPKQLLAKNAMSGRPQSRTALRQPHLSRWTREANVRRYRNLLKTQLTDLERDYIARRLAEELRG